VVPPVPIPNTEVKRLSADDTGDCSLWKICHCQETLTSDLACFIIGGGGLVVRGVNFKEKRWLADLRSSQSGHAEFSP
jgi:hypothetical protein